MPSKMTDGRLVKEARRIFRYLKKIDHLPNTSYSKSLQAEKEADFKTRIEEIISGIESSDHVNAARIGKIVREHIKNGSGNSIHADIRPYLDFPRNWKVINHELHFSD